MKNIGCFIHDTRIVGLIKDVLTMKASLNISEGRSFSVDNAYSFVKKEGIEIDRESVAAIYEQVFDLDDANFSSQDEIDEIVSKPFRDTLDNMVRMQPNTDEQKTGELSPGKAVAKRIAGIFRNAHVTDKRTKSLMKVFEDALMGAATNIANKAALPDQQAKAKPTLEEILDKAFGLEKQGFRTLSGGLNSVHQVWEEFRQEVLKYRSEYLGSGASQDQIDAFEAYTDDIISKGYDLFLSQPEAKQVLLEALTDPTAKNGGYGREVTVKGKKKTVLDWKKLAGDGGSIDIMRGNVEEVMKAKGYDDYQVAQISAALEREYISLHASVIQKATDEINRANAVAAAKPGKELARRNAARTHTGKTDARRMAELYNYGLFDHTPDTYDRILNNLFGMSEIDQKRFNELKMLAKSLETAFRTDFLGRRANELEMATMLKTINEKVSKVLSKNASSKSAFLKTAKVIQNIVFSGQRQILNNLPGAYWQNQWSGFWARLNTAAIHNKNIPKELREHHRSMMLSIFKDITAHGGTGYGEVGSQFLNKSDLDDFLRSATPAKWFQTVVSVTQATMALDATDAMYKISMTEKMFVSNLIKILTNPTNNIDGNGPMTKEAAERYVADQLMGQNWEDAKTRARGVINKINSDANNEKIVPDNESAVIRMANDLVKGALVSGGKITDKQLDAAYKSAYKAAGLSLGHEANNPITLGLTSVSLRIERNIAEALKEKNYNGAAFWTIAQTVNRGVISPFVGGATNWIVLKAEKNGLGLITGPIRWAFMRGKNVDLSSEADMARLERVLTEDLAAQQSITRSIIGAGAMFLTWLTARTACDEENAFDCYNNWRNEEEWAKKYTDEFVNEVWIYQMEKENPDKFKYYIAKTMGTSNQFDFIPQVQSAVAKYHAGDTEEANGLLGKAFSSRLNFPILFWRPVRDAYNLKQGITDKEPIKPDYSNSHSFWKEIAKGGLIELLTQAFGEDGGAEWSGSTGNAELLESSELESVEK